ncbi:hypothetical protein [Ensifer aridi]|uniref:hypothetical protein n=1 Tax=Ensifer aridi TaxID=1708715 RepID=UPI0011116FD8|nr:hypothetical protein [Ensifer aridi]
MKQIADCIHNPRVEGFLKKSCHREPGNVEGTMEHTTALLDELISFIDQLTEGEKTFGPSTALVRYGREFPVIAPKPGWLRMGEKRNCYNTATTYAVTRSDIFYVEGYAFEPELPFPVQHAWLVDANGQVIDPTYEDTTDHVYFGIAFKRDFVIDMLARNNGQAGLLVNLHLLRRQFRDPMLLEDAIRGSMALIPRDRSSGILT